MLAIAREPDVHGLDAARAYFARAGFDVGPDVAGSFSLAGPEPLMRRTFPDFDATAGERELSTAALPPDVRAALRTVVVEAPPDFGPGNP